MTIIRKLISWAALTFLLLSNTSNADIEQDIFNKIHKGQWNEAKILLDKKITEAPITNLLWGLWYGDQENPSYNGEHSIEYLSLATTQGSREAQLLLIGKYLFERDVRFVNYSEGVRLGKDLLSFYKEQIKLGKDTDGELHRIVGKFYTLGIGVEKNIMAGIKFYKKAAALGDIEAKNTLKGINH